jgi:hypothetical protein
MSSNRILPSWVSKAVDATKEEESPTTSTQQSAHFFRVECARTWHQRLYRAQRRAWSETVRSMMTQTVLNKKNEKNDRTMLEEEPVTTPVLDRYTIAPHSLAEQDCQDDKWLLPLTIVSPPPACRLDRQAITEALWDYFRTTTTTTTSLGGHGNSDRNRCCSLWLPRLLPTLHATIHLLARQCVQMPEYYDDHEEYQQPTQQAAATTAALRYYNKVSKKRTTSMQQVLLWWAARTVSYDSMVIVLEVRMRIIFHPAGFLDGLHPLYIAFLLVKRHYPLTHHCTSPSRVVVFVVVVVVSRILVVLLRQKYEMPL